MEPNAMLHSAMSQCRPGMSKDGGKKSPSLDDPNDSQPAEYAMDQTVVHRGLKDQAEYKVRWNGHSAEDGSCEPALELPTSFFR